MYATFERFEIKMTLEQARDCAHQGDCERDVRDLLERPEIKRQFKKISPNDIRAELKEYGTWTNEELADDEMNKVRILWIAAGNIKEENS